MFAVTNDIIANEFCSQIAWHLEVGLLEIELDLNPEPRASEKYHLYSIHSNTPHLARQWSLLLANPFKKFSKEP